MSNLVNKQEFLNNIINAANKNPELKEKLLNNPKEVLESTLNFKLPENFEVVVHQDTPTRLNIILPNNSEELSEAELSAVSGGFCWENCDYGW